MQCVAKCYTAGVDYGLASVLSLSVAGVDDALRFAAGSGAWKGLLDGFDGRV